MKALKLYFKDISGLTATVFILFFSSLIFSLVYNGWNYFPLLFLIIPCLYIRTYKLWFQAISDRRKSRIAEKTVTINNIEFDEKLNLRSNSGGFTGMPKYCLFDSDGCVYRFTAPNFMQQWDSFPGQSIKIRFLESSRVLLSAETVNNENKVKKNSKAYRENKAFQKEFKKAFCCYIKQRWQNEHIKKAF